jgi:uncharacterized protein
MLSDLKVSMLRLQPTPTCNLNCSYCYIPSELRRQTGTMTPIILETTLRRLVDEGLLADRLAISWHGAEPLAAGLAWYEDALTRIAPILEGHARVTHVFQSNGVLISDAWCEFFGRENAQVGVSLDGNPAQTRARVNWAGRPAHAAAMRGIDRLNRHGLSWSLLSVITADTMRDPQAYIDFVRSTGCTSLGFKVEETNVAHASALHGRGGIERDYADFVSALWHAFPENGPIAVREFDEYRSARFGRPAQAVPVTLLPFRNLTVAVNGDFTIFSGELLFRPDGRFVFGNVLDGPLLACLHGELFRSMGAELLAGARRCASECRHYADCGAFYVSQKQAETGSFDAGETLACRLEIKTMFAALDRIPDPTASAMLQAN